MKIRKARSPVPPTYPTLAELRARPELLDAMPQRGPGGSRLAALLSLGMAVRALLADPPDAEAAETEPATLAPGAAKPPATASRTAQAAVRVSALVAPLLAESLEQDGRGSFGCVAVNPPTFMAEDEALDLIEQELRAAGLNLSEHPVLQGGAPAHPAKPSEPAVKGRYSWEDRLEPPPWEVLRRNFDFADVERGIYVAFLSATDYYRWGGPGMGTAQSYDFPELARTYAKELELSHPDRPAVFGLFFDPLANDDLPGPDLVGLTPAQRKVVEAGFERAQAQERATLDKKGLEKLRRQVAHFVAYLRREGLVKPAP